MTNPMPSRARNKSITLAGSSETLFADDPNGGFVERYVHNPNAANAIWLNFVGGAAAANAAGSVKVAAGETFRLSVSNEWKVIGTAADKVTAWER